MSALDDPQEFGRRVSAARGYLKMQRPEFAELMGVSESTLWRWESGDLGKKSNNAEGRRQLAERIIARVDCPPEWFDLSEPSGGAAAELRRRIEELDDGLTAVRANLSQALLDLADARRHQGLPEHAKEGTAR